MWSFVADDQVNLANIETFFANGRADENIECVALEVLDDLSKES